MPSESISKSLEVMEINSDWHTLFMIYLRIGGLPEDKDKRELLRHQVGHYILVNDELFRRSVNNTLMRCVTPGEGCAILQGIHVGIFGSHASTRSLVGKNIPTWALLAHCRI
jgi:hypothetical protein